MCTKTIIFSCNTRIEYGYHSWFDLSNRQKRDLEAETFYDLEIGQTFVTSKPGDLTVPTSEDGLQSNIQLTSSWNKTDDASRITKNNRITHFLADR